MTSMGELKNNLEILKKHLIKMNVLESLALKTKDIQQPNLRYKNPEVFLQIINYLFTEYSTSLYREAIKIAPQIKLANDKKFLECCYQCIRSIFQYKPIITTEQFLNTKYFELKVQFLAQLSKLIFQWQLSQKPKTLVNNVYPVVVVKKQYEDDDECEYEQPKKIEILPNPIQPKKTYESQEQSFKNNNNLSQDKFNNRNPSNNPPQYNYFNNKATINNSVNNQVKILNMQQQQEPQTTTYIKMNKMQPKELKITELLQKDSNDEQQQQERPENKYVTQSQMNEYYELIKNLSQTVNQFIKKFDTLQSNVLGWVNNTNARIVILQQNVKLLKSNL